MELALWRTSFPLLTKYLTAFVTSSHCSGNGQLASNASLISWSASLPLSSEQKRVTSSFGANGPSCCVPLRQIHTRQVVCTCKCSMRCLDTVCLQTIREWCPCWIWGLSSYCSITDMFEVILVQFGRLYPTVETLTLQLFHHFLSHMLALPLC